ncbi:hypothetical protein FB567DRAFT_481542 [Paraphoma chrysanthemicola]|uniref:RanBP2-type domain-containing protein n=1 Tax=Paraphoma chrysanthemicola TaxID=798071 RepID=A0A8K0QVX6_9PLEO|nr:hypothetical protein FB567DRAFT_481542 [Paraphoma chrysanthemicola]
MEIPRGHAAMPLTEADFLDFIYNYFKAEYAPIRSFWSTATADPRQPSRWINLGHELSPLSIRPANAQAQKDIESVDYFTKKWNLDATFVRGLAIRYAKYEVHERLEKKLYECARLDLMVRKALKEKHLIDALWPSPAPRTISKDLLEQGVQIRRWYGDMFNKYFRVLRSLDEFELRPEVNQRIVSSGTLMLIPFIDHLALGTVDPIMPIVAKGAGYANAKGWERKDGTSRSDSYGEPGRFEIRFDAPADVQDTYTKNVVRQCQCNKCGTKRDVQILISVDPSPPSGSSASASRRQNSKAAQRYAPGYNMPGSQDAAPRQPPRPQAPPEEAPRAPTPDRKKQCPRCTFLNHAELTACEMCQADLPDATIQKPPSPVSIKVSHSHSASQPPPLKPEAQQKNSLEVERPAPPNRHSLSSTLFSIFSQQQPQDQHAQQPPKQHTEQTNTARSQNKSDHARPSSKHEPDTEPRPSSSRRKDQAPTTSPEPSTPPQPTLTRPAHDPETPLSRAPEMAMMPLTPPPTTSATRPAPAGLPSNLMDDFVPVSPALPRDDEDEDAGWGEMSREEARGESSDEDDDEGRRGGLVDLDAVAREEADVWGEREDE